MFSGSRRFHRRIQSQEIRLERDLVDHGDNVCNLPAAFIDLAHRLDGLDRDRTALIGYVAGHNSQLVRLLGAVGILFYRGRHLLHCAGRFFQRGSLLASPLCEILVTLGDFLRSRCHVLRRLMHGGEGMIQIGDRDIEADPDLIEIAVARLRQTGIRYPVRQISLRQVRQYPLDHHQKLFHLRRLRLFHRYLCLERATHLVEPLRQRAQLVLRLDRNPRVEGTARQLRHRLAYPDDAFGADAPDKNPNHQDNHQTHEDRDQYVLVDRSSIGGRFGMIDYHENRPIHAGVAQRALEVRIANHLRHSGTVVGLNREAGIAGYGPFGRHESTIGQIGSHQHRKVVPELVGACAGRIVLRKNLSVLIEKNDARVVKPRFFHDLLGHAQNIFHKRELGAIAPVGHDFSVPIDRGGKAQGKAIVAGIGGLHIWIDMEVFDVGAGRDRIARGRERH